MLRVFIIKRFTIVLILVYLVVFGLFYIYQVSNFFLTYQTKSTYIFIDVVKSFFPIVLFYTSPINISMAMFITSFYLKRIKMFFVAQSFGIAPKYIFIPFLTISFLLSFLNIIVNQDFLPNAVRNLKYIEHIYKKNQSYKLGVVNNFWTQEKLNHENVFIGASLVSSNGDFYDFKLITVKNGHFISILKAKKATLEKGMFSLNDATMINLNPFSKTYHNILDIKADMDVSKLHLWTKTPDEQSLNELLRTIFVMRKEGLNIYPYLSILVFKLEFSFLPFLLICVLSFYIVKSQKTIDWYKSFLLHSLIFGIVVITPYSISSKINLNPLYFLPIYLLSVFYSIKRFLDINI